MDSGGRIWKHEKKCIEQVAIGYRSRLFYAYLHNYTEGILSTQGKARCVLCMSHPDCTFKIIFPSCQGE